MTAIEYLVEKIDIKNPNWLLDEIKKAKEMELEQLEEAYKKGFNDASPSSNEFGSISIGKI
jgi:hypothetical protein